MFGISLKTIPFPPLIKFDLFYMLQVINGDHLDMFFYLLLVIAGEAGEQLVMF